MNERLWMFSEMPDPSADRTGLLGKPWSQP